MITATWRGRRAKSIALRIAAGGHDFEQILQGHDVSALASFRAYPSIG